MVLACYMTFIFKALIMFLTNQLIGFLSVIFKSYQHDLFIYLAFVLFPLCWSQRAKSWLKRYGFRHNNLYSYNFQVIGDPLNRGTAHGPQNHKAHLDKLLEYIDVGIKEGATLVHGGTRVDRPGYFLHPTVFTDVEDHMFIAKEESFGPIMVISKFPNG